MKRSVQPSGKLASYSAAAALGAFAAHQAAEGAIIYTDLTPDDTVQFGDNGLVNLDNSGYREVSIVVTSTAIQVRDAYAGNILTSSGTYYVKGFNPGDLIGPASNEASDGGSHVGAKKNSYNFFAGNLKYIGVKFTISGQTHYGWVGFEVDSTNPLHGIVRDYAYEATPDTAIVAGDTGPIPEPASLALLAAGAGAIALRRRQVA